MVCDCVVTHHPLLFQPIKSIDVNVSPGSLIANALCHGIHVIAAHTCLDVCRDGTNEQSGTLVGTGILGAAGNRYRLDP